MNVWTSQFVESQSFHSVGAGVGKYTDCISADGQDFPNECPRYDTK